MGVGTAGVAMAVVVAVAVVVVAMVAAETEDRRVADVWARGNVEVEVEAVRGADDSARVYGEVAMWVVGLEVAKRVVVETVEVVKAEVATAAAVWVVAVMAAVIVEVVAWVA